MKVGVCVKRTMQVADAVETTPDGTGLDPNSLDPDINEWDVCAVEEGLRMCDAAGGGEIFAVTLGDESADAALRRALAMGVDRAVRVDAEAIDPFSIAQVLAGHIAREAPDVVLCGAQSADTAQAATGSTLAELLGFPVVTLATRVELDHSRRTARVHRERDGGSGEIVEVPLPCVISVQTGINEPRYVTLRALKQADAAPLTVAPAGEAGPPAFRIRRILEPSSGGSATMLDGSPAEVASQIADLIRSRIS